MKLINIFDLDHTIISIDSEYSLMLYLYKIGKINKNKKKKIDILFKKYICGEMDFKKYQSIYLSILERGISKKKINNFFIKNIKKKIYKRIYKILKANNSIINTSSNYLTVNYLCKKILNEKHIICSNFKKINNFREYKVINFLIEIFKKNKIYSKYVFFTDSINDICMLKFSDECILVNPDEKLIKYYKLRKVKILFVKTTF